MTELYTQRLLLRAPRPDDAPSYALGIGDYEVAIRLAELPWPYSLAMATEWLRGAPAPRPDHAFFIIERPGRGLIGAISILPELGYWLARPHWGHGYLTEAATALITWHFAGCDRQEISASAQHNNLASLRVLAKLGFSETGRERRFCQALQHNVEHVLARLSRQDWMNGGGRMRVTGTGCTNLSSHVIVGPVPAIQPFKAWTTGTNPAVTLVGRFAFDENAER